MIKDFQPTKETISLHGLGFIQIILPNFSRLHVWHPALPKRSCYEHSAIHNHRFGFQSQIIKGVQKNVRCHVEVVKPNEGTHLLISHNGPRSPKGGRLSYPVADVNIYEGETEQYGPGDKYSMAPFEYHHTPVHGNIVITLMKKTEEVQILHANSTCRKGVDFHYDFDRFQLNPKQLYEYVVDAFDRV